MTKRKPKTKPVSSRPAPRGRLLGRGVSHPSKFDKAHPKKIFVLHDNEARQRAAGAILDRAIQLSIQDTPCLTS